MNQIKFSKEYVKLHGQTEGTLLAVVKIRITKENPCAELVDYDTLAEDGSRYVLKRGNYLQLVFLGNLGIPFCTIRSDKPAMNGLRAKYDYYREKIGERFQLLRILEQGEKE